MVLQLILKEWNDFYTAALSKDRANEIEIGQGGFLLYNTTSNKITIGKTFGRVITIATYKNCLWYYKFFIPIGIIHYLVSSIVSLLFDDHGMSFSLFDSYYNNHSYEENRMNYYLGFLSHLYIIAITTCTMIYGIATILSKSSSSSSSNNNNNYSTRRFYNNNNNEQLSIVYSINCIIPTIKNSGIHIALVVLVIMVPSNIIIYFIQQSKIMIDEFFLYTIGDYIGYAGLIHTLFYDILALLDIVVVGIIIYFCTLITIIVLPCTIFEHVSNPIHALYRSYKLTHGHRATIFIMSCIGVFFIAVIEAMVASIKYDIFYEYYTTNYYSETFTIKWFIVKCLTIIPELIFIPFLAIFQTVIYCNISSINEIRSSNLNTNGSSSNGGIILTSTSTLDDSFNSTSNSYNSPHNNSTNENVFSSPNQQQQYYSPTTSSPTSYNIHNNNINTNNKLQ